MGLLKGRATITRYTVSGEPPAGFWDFIDRRVKAHAFKDIESSTEELSVGWCAINDYFDTEFAFMAYAMEPYVLLGLRVDQRRVPATLLKKYHRLEMDKAKSYLDEGRNLGRVRREELKDKARLGLLARIPPETKLYEMVWDTARGELWLGAATRKVMDLFEEHFVASFGLELTPRLPFLVARDLVAGSQLAPALEEARPWGPLAWEQGA